MIEAFFLTVSMGLAHGAAEGNPEHQDALKIFTKATYKEFGFDRQAKKLERRYIPENVRVYGAWTIQASRLIIEKKITYEWTF